MTWPAAIATGIGVLAAYLLTRPQHHQHRSTTTAAHPQDGEPRS